VETLRWLREHGCPCSKLVIDAAAEGASVSVLAYLQAEGLINSTDKLTVLLRIAGVHSEETAKGCTRLAAAQWLRQQGAEWPRKLCYEGRPWSEELVAWARAEGCTSPVPVSRRTHA
jgi:hypothetical protein